MYAFACRHPVYVLRKFPQPTRSSVYTAGEVWRRYKRLYERERLRLANGIACERRGKFLAKWVRHLNQAITGLTQLVPEFENA